MGTELIPKILKVLSASDGPVLSDDAFPSIPSQTVYSALQSLVSRDMVIIKPLSHDQAILSDEGNEFVEYGSHEARLFQVVQKAVKGLKEDDLIAELPDLPGYEDTEKYREKKKKDVRNGQNKALAAGWIKRDKGIFKAKVESITDTTRKQLLAIRETPRIDYGDIEQKKRKEKELKELRGRKLVSIQKVTTYEISKGKNYSTEFVKEETDLTADMIASGAWKTIRLKPYNFDSKGALTESGALHPLNKVRHEFRQIFFEMGFEEMPTNCYVETGFWNFDALFVPQQHPARDMQDTFFISDPAKADKPRGPQREQQLLPNGSNASKVNSEKLSQDYEEYWDNVKETHENGKYGSIGYRYPWKESESLRLVLRTHTTATSTYMLRQLASNPRPARYFSIDRVFRNESVDATHLAEFHQVEGVIADWDLSLGGLIGFMEVFFAKMGIHNLRFKPAYNPYTEPSLEIFSYHVGLGKWVEIGNSGMFRPEMLEPMGLPKDMRVYGWGLSLERPTMIKYGVKNIRELLGHKVELSFIESNPAVRLEKD